MRILALMLLLLPAVSFAGPRITATAVSTADGATSAAPRWCARQVGGRWQCAAAVLGRDGRYQCSAPARLLKTGKSCADLAGPLAVQAGSNGSGVRFNPSSFFDVFTEL